MLPVIARDLGVPYSSREGWLSGYFSQFVADGSDQLAVCFPIADRETMNIVKKRMIGGFDSDIQEMEAVSVAKFMLGQTSCYGFRADILTPEKYDASLEVQMKLIYDNFQPDIVHIFGSEYPHALAMGRVSSGRKRTVLSIQGLCGKIAAAYTDGIPTEVISDETIRDLVRHDAITQQQQKFEKRAEHEKELFTLITHVTGRTGFDRETAKELNPNIIYHHLNESLRESFYQGRWSRDKCEPYSIFLSQGDYPVKGFHYMLSAMPSILRDFPSAHLYVAGNSIIGKHGDAAMFGKLKGKLKLSSYGKYIQSLIFRYHLEDKVTMLGSLDEEIMKARFLMSNVFVCPSTIENSSNSLCEAMLLGMPVVAAGVGGIFSLIDDDRNGLLYEPGNVADLAAAVKIAFEEETALRISAEAAKKAVKTHNRVINYLRLMDIYREVMR
jgi:glycosyltransferase involved in cell wall biosynthesis